VAQAAVSVRALTVTLGGKEILSSVDLDIPVGSVTALIGPNGAGKTTLLRAILELVPYRGKISFAAGSNGRRPRIGYIPQHIDIERENPIRVLDFLLLTRTRFPLWLGTLKRDRKAIEEALGAVGASDVLLSPIGKLSGGEMQRVLLAKAVMESPDIVLMDEPVSGIDASGEQLFCQIIESMHLAQKATIVMVSHDLSVVNHHATHVVCVNRQIKCVGDTVEVMTPENLQMLYGHGAGLVRHDPAHLEGRHSARL
jgi:zinc transport system ATP-binding protein